MILQEMFFFFWTTPQNELKTQNQRIAIDSLYT